MHLTMQMEQLSKAYVKAVAAAAGCKWSSEEVDDDSVDVTLSRRSVGTTVLSPKLDIQLKSSLDAEWKIGVLAYPLKQKNYDDLRATSVHTPRILVFVDIHSDGTQWVNVSPSKTTIKRCGYWMSLRGFPGNTNVDNTTIQLSQAKTFDVQSLKQIFSRLESGALP